MIRSLVAPALDEVLAPLGARVELLDLRWGVDTTTAEDEQRAHQQVLDVCVGEIERCRPLFVGLLGDRFGWVPPAERLLTATAWSSGADLPPGWLGRLSVTGLEFWRGALALDAGADAVFAVRSLAGDVPGDWVDADPAGVAWLRGEVAAATQRSPGRIHRLDYSAKVSDGAVSGGDLEAFAQRLVDALSPMVMARAQELERTALSPYGAAARLLAESRSIVVGRDDLLAQIAGHLDAGTSPGVVLVGSSGVGKTSVLLAAGERAEAGGWHVAKVLVGAGPASTSTADVIGLLAGQLGLVIPTEQSQQPSLGADDQDGGRPIKGESLLAWWAAALAGVPERTLIAIDGLDRLDPGDARDTVEVLRSVPGAGPRFLATTTLADQAEALVMRGLVQLQVSPLAARDAGAAARAWARADGGRQLPQEVLDVLAGQPRSGLWVRLAVTELAWLDATDYTRAEAAAAAGADPARALVDLLVAEARALPDTDGALADRLLQRASDILADQDRSALVLGALALTRSGLAPADLQGLAGIADALSLTRARRLLGPQLAARDETGRLAFDHQVLRDAALLRAGEAGVAAPRLHGSIADHLVASGSAGQPDLVATGDQLWHSLLSGDPERAAAALNLSRDSALTLSDAGDVIAGAIVAGRGADSDVLRTIAELADLHRGLNEGTLRQLGTAAIEHGETDLLLVELELLTSVALAMARRLAAADPGSAQAARDVAVSLVNIGGAAMAVGDLAAAQEAYTESLAIARRLAAAHPAGARAARDVAVSLNYVGRAAMASGDLAAAREAYLEMLGIARRLAAADPGSERAARAVVVAGGDLVGMWAAYTEMQGMTRRLAADARTARAARDVAVALDGVGRAAMTGGDLAAARAAFSEGLAVRRRLTAADPGSARAARDVSVALNHAGDAAMAGGDLNGAWVAYTEALGIARRLAAADQRSAQAARDVSESLWRLAQLVETAEGDPSEAAQAAWSEVVRQFDAMRARGWIRPVDEGLETIARQWAASSAAGEPEVLYPSRRSWWLRRSAER